MNNRSGLLTKYIHGKSNLEQERLVVLNQLLNQRCLDRLHLEGHENILDVGCGLGIFSRMMASHLTSGRVVGIEQEWEQIDKGKKLAFGDLADSLDTRQGSAFDLPLETNEWNTFDLGFVRFLLEHLSNPGKVVRQVYDALRPGGKLVLIDDDHANFRIVPRQSAFDRLWEAYISVYQSKGNDPFVGRNLTTLLNQSGFIQLKIDFVLFGATADQLDFIHYVNNLKTILSEAAELMKSIYRTGHNVHDDLEALQGWSRLPDATIWYVANWAEGRKP
ncbi:MAG: methyltransferase domain-containing protein [Saprospiraceae bacterium]|nr:methyltransferase domain-containing protein [Saprospiraceae bacterium]